MSNFFATLVFSGYDHPLIMSGQGTIGLEIVEQCEGADAIVVPGRP